MRDHELRNVLNDELHGRPGLPVTAPSRITHLAFTIGEGDADPLVHVKQLCDALGVKPPADGVPHHSVEIDGGQFKYERHGEFYRISVHRRRQWRARKARRSPSCRWAGSMSLPGQRLVAIHTHILAQSAKPTRTHGIAQGLFGHDDLAGSQVSSGSGHRLDRFPHRRRWLYPHAGA